MGREKQQQRRCSVVGIIHVFRMGRDQDGKDYVVAYEVKCPGTVAQTTNPDKLVLVPSLGDSHGDCQAREKSQYSQMKKKMMTIFLYQA
jgi:hypothetical protein